MDNWNQEQKGRECDTERERERRREEEGHQQGQGRVIEGNADNTTERGAERVKATQGNLFWNANVKIL